MVIINDAGFMPTRQMYLRAQAANEIHAHMARLFRTTMADPHLQVRMSSINSGEARYELATMVLVFPVTVINGRVDVHDPHLRGLTI